MMKFATQFSLILATVLASGSDAFVAPASRSASTSFMKKQSSQPSLRTSLSVLNSKAEDDDEEIERLKTMAARLRAEAAALEAAQAQEMADAAERAFRKFDTNQDGQISLEELKAGLEKAFKTELPEKRVKKLMEDFDKTGDGALQLDEFVGVDKFRNRLDQLAREEKAYASEKAKQAKLEQEAMQLLQAQVEMINDKPPTNSDKILSVLPYLFPLLDGLNYGRFLIMENADNILVAIIALIYALYRSIPFGGFVAFFALSFLSGNPSINRLVRFNMQQAIYLDIALFFPGLIGALYSVVGGAAGFKLPAVFTEIGSDIMFFSLLAVVGYATVSSLLGITPNKIPLISDAVEQRMPSIDMFDSEGRFNPRNKKDDDKN